VLSFQTRPVDFLIIHEPRSNGKLLGTFGGCDISEFVLDQFGHRYEYVGLASRRWNGNFDGEVLRAGEFIVEPGLVYKRLKPDGRKYGKLIEDFPSAI
jgi:hypothetical protein